MQGHESQARAQSGVEPHRCDYRAATRTHTHFFAFAQVVLPRIFRRQIDRFATAQRRSIHTALDACVVGVETAARGKANGILLIELIDGRLLLYTVERSERSDQRLVPEPSVKKHFPGMRLVIAGPLYAAELFQSLITHARIHRAELAKFIPDTFRVRAAPIMSEPSRQIEDDRYVIAYA